MNMTAILHVDRRNRRTLQIVSGNEEPMPARGMDSTLLRLYPELSWSGWRRTLGESPGSTSVWLINGERRTRSAVPLGYGPSPPGFWAPSRRADDPGWRSAPSSCDRHGFPSLDHARQRPPRSQTGYDQGRARLQLPGDVGGGLAGVELFPLLARPRLVRLIGQQAASYPCLMAARIEMQGDSCRCARP